MFLLNCFVWLQFVHLSEPSQLLVHTANKNNGLAPPSSSDQIHVHDVNLPSIAATLCTWHLSDCILNPTSLNQDIAALYYAGCFFSSTFPDMKYVGSLICLHAGELNENLYFIDNCFCNQDSFVICGHALSAGATNLCRQEWTHQSKQPEG